MSTPTDPYNSDTAEPIAADNTAQPFDAAGTSGAYAEAASAGNSAAAEVHESPSVAYGNSDALAWETAFEVEDNRSAPQLDELSFDDDIPMGDPGFRDPKITDEAHDPAPSTPSNAPNESYSAHILTDAEPLAEGATFASAYSATGVTELPAEDPVADDEVLDAEPEPPVRESVFPAAGASPSTETHSEWTTEPEAPRLTDLPEEPKSRVWAHIGSIFATLLLVPVVWYLISDAGIRLNLVENSPWETGHVSIAALIEFIGGMIALFVLWLMARASSLGAQIWGFLLTIAGFAALIVPNLGHRLISLLDHKISSFNAFTGNIVHHLDLDLGSGRIAIFGFILFLTGVMIHLGRKSSERRAVAKTVREQLLGE